MKKIFLLILLINFISCKEKGNEYYSIIIQKDTWGGKNKIEEKADTIYTKNDSLAMVSNLRSFYLRYYQSQKLSSISSDYSVEILDYKLLDSNNKPIVNNLPDSIKENIKLSVKKSVDNSFNRLENTKPDVDNQFSSWNGSHIKLTEYIKLKMNNPSSYEHVETKYKVNKDFVSVFTKIRGTNAFGAIITSTYNAKCNLYTGEVISVE